jgi:hypothetical protein
MVLHWLVHVSGGRHRLSNFPGVGLLFTIHPQQSTSILLPALQEASNSILWQDVFLAPSSKL